MAGIGVKQTLATQPQWLLLGKADSSKVVNLTNMNGWYRPEAVMDGLVADLLGIRLNHCDQRLQHIVGCQVVTFQGYFEGWQQRP